MPTYIPVFESLSDSTNVLEIGIGTGPSLNMLAAAFPNATIHGFDVVNSEHWPLSRPQVVTHVGDQENRGDLQKLVEECGNKPFDLILDDGGHTMRQQQISLGYLFKHLKNGGVYILEDLHTSRMPSYIAEDCLKTSLDMLIEFNETNKIISNYMTQQEIEYLENNIESIQIWSRTEEMANSVTSIIKKKF
jgi:predicted O-methyltransferase YrrM